MLSVYTVAMIRHPSLCRGRCHRHWSLVDEDLHRGTPGSVWVILSFETTISPFLSVIDPIESLALQPGGTMVVTGHGFVGGKGIPRIRVQPRASPPATRSTHNNEQPFLVL